MILHNNAAQKAFCALASDAMMTRFDAYFADLSESNLVELIRLIHHIMYMVTELCSHLYRKIYKR